MAVESENQRESRAVACFLLSTPVQSAVDGVYKERRRQSMTKYLRPRHPDLLSRRELARFAMQETDEARKRLRADAEVRRRLEAAKARPARVKETRCGCGGRCGCGTEAENAAPEYMPPRPYYLETPKGSTGGSREVSVPAAKFMAPVPYHQDRKAARAVNAGGEGPRWPESFAERAELIQAACEELRRKKMA